MEKAIHGLFPLGQHPKTPRVFGIADRRIQAAADFFHSLLGHFRKKWHDEAGGGKTFCLSVFLGGVVLSRPQPCCPLPPPADNQYVTFCVAFYVTQKVNPLG